MKKNKILMIVLAVLVAFSLSACDIIDKIIDLDFGESEEPSVPVDTPEIIEPVDPNWPVSAFGTEIEKAPEKVAVASPALAEYISDMGLLERVCAISDYCNFGGASSMDSIGSVSLPDMEAIEKNAPEYILSFAQYEESILIELQQMNISVIVIENPKNLDELRELYRQIALFFCGAVDGVSFGGDYVAEYNAALSEMAYSGEKKSAGFIRALDYIMITGGTLEQEFISASGIINAAENQSGYSFDPESWSDFNPEVLFVNSDIHLIDLESSDLYKKKSAVKGDKVFNADLDSIGICSKRSIIIMKDVLATLYPDYTGGTAYSPAYPSLYS